jgi:two-component system sensor histidine kinase DevS
VPDPLVEASEEFQERVLMALNRASLAVASDLSLEKTLQQIADSARDIVGAKYAALGNFDEQGRMMTFVTSGLPPDAGNAIPHPPMGRGLLKAILDERQILRVPVIGDDPRSVGFPPGHPEMTSFLGVPIVAGQDLYGNLYLTDKIDASAFTRADEELIGILASHAAAAIRNAELFESIERYSRQLEDRNRELAAVNAVARVSSDATDIGRVLEQTLDEILSVTQMDASEVFLLDETSGDLMLRVHRGAEAESFYAKTRFARGEGIPGKALAEDRVILSYAPADVRDHARPGLLQAGFETFVSIPIRAKQAIIGVMDLASRDRRAFAKRDLELLEAIGLQMGIAVENAHLYDEIGRLAVIDERSRIGMDLHDGVIQSIYAVGLTLETIRLVMQNDQIQAEGLLDQAIAGLNEAIRDIRNFILDLRPHRFEGDLEQGISRLVREFRANAMVELAFEPPSQLLESIGQHTALGLFLTTQEALANIARHAKANNVRIEITREDNYVVLTIEDDGLGFDTSRQSETVGHGLANMRSRAEDLCGEFSIRSAPGEGTTIRMGVPL